MVLSTGQKQHIHSWIPPPDGLRSLFLEGIREIAHDRDYEIYIASSGFTYTIKQNELEEISSV